MNEPKLKDRVALVTGGGTGMGRAIALLLAREGAGVMINYSQSRKGAEEVACDIETAGGTAVAWRADVASDAEVRRMIGAVQERWGRLDVLVNNAGWTQRVPHHQLEDLTDAIWDHTLNTNLRGAFYTVRAAAPLLKKSANAAIVNIASTAAYNCGGSSMIYAASKAALLAMTKSMARALAPEVRVNAVCPGMVRTRFASWPAEAHDAAERATPLGRLATVEDIAQVVLFLAADALAVTGESIIADGGAFRLPRAR